MAAAGRCAIEVGYSGPGSVGSWNEINNAVAAVFNQVRLLRMRTALRAESRSERIQPATSPAPEESPLSCL